MKQLKTFKAFVNEIEVDKKGVIVDPKGLKGNIPQENLKNAYVRDENHANSIPDSDIKKMYKFEQSKIVGWFATKYNMAEGYIVTILDSEDKKEFGKDAFRVYWGKGTTIVKIDLIKGKISFLDNKVYEDESKIKWQRPMAYDRFFIDNKKESFRVFDIV